MNSQIKELSLLSQIKTSNQMDRISLLTWVFFASKGLTDNCDLMRAQMYIMECTKDGATVESVKNSTGYRSCLNDLPDCMLTDEYIKEIIEFKR